MPEAKYFRIRPESGGQTITRKWAMDAWVTAAWLATKWNEPYLVVTPTLRECIVTPDGYVK